MYYLISNKVTFGKTKGLLRSDLLKTLCSFGLNISDVPAQIFRTPSSPSLISCFSPTTLIPPIICGAN
jgi:hypothetical protein